MSSVEDDSQPVDPLSGIPSLTTSVLTSENDKVAALKLVADSIAQQRQQASRALIFHPITIALYAVIIGLVTKILYKSRSDLGLLATTSAGVTMACLILIRGLTSGYIAHAESFGWPFARTDDGEEDVLIGSRYGEQLIGACILRLERAGNGKKRKAGGKGMVRAWTTKMRYRGTGVGTELLEEAVRVTREKLGSSAEIGFVREHANSKMVLPDMFNGVFRTSERRATKALEKVVERIDGKRKR